MTEGNRLRAVVAMVLLAVAVVPAIPAVAAEGHAGKWRGEIDLSPDQQVVAIMELQPADTSGWTGTIKTSVSPRDVMTLQDLVVGDVEVAFTVTLPGLPGANQRFTGRLDGDRIRGTFVAGAGRRAEEYDLNFRRMSAAEEEGLTPPAGSPLAAYDTGNPLSGSWSARSSDEDEARRLNLELGLDNAQNVSGTITDTGTGETTTLRDIAFEENTVAFNFRPADAPALASFWGRYIPADDEIRGTFSLGGRSQPLTFERVGRSPARLEDEFAPPPRPRKHFSRLGASARAALWQPIYVLRKNERNINDVTSGSSGFDAGVRFYLMDTLGLQARYFRGGLGFDTNDANLALFAPDVQGDGLVPALTSDAYLGITGYEFALMGYVGPLLFPTSRFNPYVIGAAGKVSWDLGRDGRGSDPLAIFEVPLEGDDWSFGGGLGTEYAINERIGVELEWFWTFIASEDTDKWADNELQWTNTHAYRLSLGAVVWF